MTPSSSPVAAYAAPPATAAPITPPVTKLPTFEPPFFTLIFKFTFSLLIVVIFYLSFFVLSNANVLSCGHECKKSSGFSTKCMVLSMKLPFSVISSLLLSFEFPFTVRTVLVLLEDSEWLESYKVLASGIWTSVVVD